MRPDMSEVLIERPRTKGSVVNGRPKGYKKALTRHIANDEAPTKERMSRWDKELTDLLGPLKRFLHKQVGRPWDKVYAEIAANMPQSSAAKSHVRDHVFGYVYLANEIKILVVEKQKRVFRKVKYSWSGGQEVEITSSHSYPQFYVHPATGILREARKESNKYRPKKEEHLWWDEDHAVKKIEGIWYKIEVEDFDRALREHNKGRFFPVGDLRDVTQYERYPVSRDFAIRLYGKPVIGVKKMQMNKKEIQRINQKRKSQG